MSGKKLICVLGILLPTLTFSTTAFGWIGTTHATICMKTFHDPVVTPHLSLLTTDQRNSIAQFIGEPGEYQSGQWDNIAARAYIEGGESPNDLDWWGLSETERLKYMQHNTSDVAVPVGHSPACYNPGGYTNDVWETYLELFVAEWAVLPVDVVGTCQYTHTRTGHTYNMVGSYDQIIDTFYDACRDNMNWFKNSLTRVWIPGKGYILVHTPDSMAIAGRNGLRLALMLQRAVFVDYFLARLSPVASATGADRVVHPGETVHFNAANSYDPDEIIWDIDGTYHNIGTSPDAGLRYWWDFNNDAVVDWVDDDPQVNMTYDQLLALGMPTNQWVDCAFLLVDNEGKVGCDMDAIYLSTGGAPEPASLSLLAIGGLALLKRRRKA